MKRYSRLIVLFILCIPLLLAAYGWTLLRESSFYFLYLLQPDGSLETTTAAWRLAGHVLGGLLLMTLGLSFLGGFFWHRHRKRSQHPYPSVLSTPSINPIQPTDPFDKPADGTDFRQNVQTSKQKEKNSR